MTDIHGRLIYDSTHPKPLLPHNHQFVDPICEEAYLKCVEYEQSGLTGEQTAAVFARTLGYLISEAFDGEGQRCISEQIMEYSKVDGGLAKLARIYIKHVILRFVSKDDVDSLLCYSDAVLVEDLDYATLRFLSRMQSQNYRCPLTKTTDIYFILRKQDLDAANLLDDEAMHRAHIRCVHFMPNFEKSEVDLKVDEIPPNGEEPLILVELWRRYFCVSIKSLLASGQTFYSPVNTLGVEYETACRINRLDIWLDHDTNPETKKMECTFDVALDVAHITPQEVERYPQRVNLGDVRMPSMMYLKIHACISRVYAWSGLKNVFGDPGVHAEGEEAILAEITPRLAQICFSAE
ncbi:hypothetical protein CVT24_001233 [Panaeolus cyanescens]|uniref:Uncharacterized protein n=1 Tax=Panaeolus cyanescens TaxID=181874 RepID=A0A409YZ32_9AGAR|nr:hypothetical protein CVT24_001233 [Panaeolus cyanescens]